jgi:hypothetical protein
MFLLIIFIMSTPTKFPTTVVGTVLVDRSGSMNSILPTLLKSLHSFLDEIKQTSSYSVKTYFRLSTFSVTRYTVFPVGGRNEFGDIKTLNNDDIQFNTYGCTRLIDSAIEEVDLLNTKLDELHGHDTMSWFVLLTDGEDNLSQTPSLDLRDKIKALKERGVSCMFMGANIDAIQTGSQFGFEEGQSLQIELDDNQDQDINMAPLSQGFRAVSDNITSTMFDDTHDSSFSTMQRISSAPNMFNSAINPGDEFETSLPTLQRSTNLPEIPLTPIPHLNMSSESDVEIENDEFDKMVEALQF